MRESGRHGRDNVGLQGVLGGAGQSRRDGRRRAAAARRQRRPPCGVTDGKTQVLNGPYAETKEQLGGYYMIDVPDLDAALSWARALPGRQPRHGRGPADLGDVTWMIACGPAERPRRVARRKLRQARRLSRRAHARRGGRRGRAGRSLRRRARRLAAQRHAAQPRRPGC